MKIFIKTLKGTHFEIQVKPDDSVADVKKNIETVQGSDVYPAAQQMLIYQGKILKDATTLDEHKVLENGFIVIMLTKNKSSPGEGSTTSTETTTKDARRSSPRASNPISNTPEASLASLTPPAPAPAHTPASVPAPTPASTVPAPTPASTVPAGSDANVYGQAASNLVAGNILEETIQQILDMGGGTWDRDTVIRALRAAYNNPERAVEYLYSGIPEPVEVPLAPRLPVAGTDIPPAQQAQPASVPSSVPNANPLDLFPQGLPNVGSTAAGAGTLEFLRNSQQFQALRAMVQANPQILQPMLQELAKQNPHLMRLIQEHQADFIRLINEPVEGGEGSPLGQVASAMPQTISVTPEEREAIERLEAMGFDRAIVLEVFFACNKNEELAANYLLDHMHEFEE